MHVTSLGGPWGGGSLLGWKKRGGYTCGEQVRLKSAVKRENTVHAQNSASGVSLSY